MTHPLITSSKEHRAICKERDRIQAAQTRWLERVSKEGRDYDQRHAKFAEEQRRAALAGEQPRIKNPGPPPEPAVSPLVFIEELARIDQAERAWLVRNAARLEVDLAAREQELLAEAAGFVDRLRLIGAELDDIAGSVGTIRAATGDGRPVDHRPSSAVGVVQLATSGRTRLAPSNAASGTQALPMNLDTVDIR